MSFATGLVLGLLPQALLAGTSVVCAVVALVRPRERSDLFRWLACIGLLGAVAACGFQLAGMRMAPNGVGLTLWNGGLVVDRFSAYVTVSACVLGLLTALLSDTYLRRVGARSGAFFALLLVAVAATSAVAGQRETITFFVALQVLLVACAGMTAMLKSERNAAQAAWALLRDGLLASSLVLYGVAILYGVTGNDNLAGAGRSLTHSPALGAIGVTLALLGLTLFTGMVPLQRWIARTADALPAVPAGFIVSITMMAGAVALLRFGVSGLGPGVRLWTALTACLVAATTVYAGVAALRADRVSGLLAACVSGQGALLLMALLNPMTGAAGAPGEGTAAFLFALVVFGLSTIGSFAALALLQTAGLRGDLHAFRGLAQRAPTAALMLALALATLAGAPPLAGFLARLLIVTSALDAGYGWLVIVALLGMVVTLVAVARTIASMYAEVGEDLPFTVAATPRLGRVVTVVCCLAAVYLTVLAQPLLLLARGGAGPLL